MMQSDDVRNRRIQAEQDATFDPTDHRIIPDYYPAQISLALWTIAEQLFELRALISISLERNK